MSDEAPDQVFAGTQSFQGGSVQELMEFLVADFFFAHCHEVTPHAILEDLPQQSGDAVETIFPSV